MQISFGAVMKFTFFVKLFGLPFLLKHTASVCPFLLQNVQMTFDLSSKTLFLFIPLKFWSFLPRFVYIFSLSRYLLAIACPGVGGGSMSCWLLFAHVGLLILLRFFVLVVCCSVINGFLSLNRPLAWLT